MRSKIVNAATYMTTNVVADVVKNIVKSYINTLRKNLSKIATMIQIIIPVALSMCAIPIAGKVVLSCLFLFVCRVVREVSDKINHRCFDGLPVPRERFTHVDTNGFTEFTCDSMQDVLMYMTELEEYFEAKGLMK